MGSTGFRGNDIVDLIEINLRMWNMDSYQQSLNQLECLVKIFLTFAWT